MNLLLLDDGETTLPARDPRVRHVRKILKLGPGDSIKAGLVNGPVGTATIESFDGRHMHVRFTPDVSDAPGAAPKPGETRRAVDMVLGHPRPIVLKRMLKDLATVGVGRLFVVPTELGEKSYLASRMWDNIRPHLIEGASQAGVTRLMEVTRCGSLPEGLREACLENQVRLILHPNPERLLLSALAASPSGSVVLAVGSERGWTPGEVEVFNAAGFTTVGMGERILRTETAAAVAAWAGRSL